MRMLPSVLAAFLIVSVLVSSVPQDDIQHEERASLSSSEWYIYEVDSDGDVGFSTSIALDNNDNPHISYYDYSHSDLKYARWTGDNWSIQTVVSAGRVGTSNSVALDSSDSPCISYSHDFRDHWELKFARWNGSMWEIDSVDSTGSSALLNSLDLDSGDNPHISLPIEQQSEVCKMERDWMAC